MCAFAVGLLASTFFTVSPGEVAIKTRLGEIKGHYIEGLHAKVPIVDSVTLFSVRVVRDDIKTEAFSKDLQAISSHLAVAHRIQLENVIPVYRNYGSNYLNTLIEPFVQETFKSITATMQAQDIIANRPVVIEELNKRVKNKMAENNIIVTDISIIDLSFSKEFTRAVEQKQIADQSAQTAQRLIVKAKMDAEQQIAKAQAEATALRLQKESVTTELIKLRQVEAQIKAIDKWDGHMPQYVGSAVPFLDVANIK